MIFICVQSVTEWSNIESNAAMNGLLVVRIQSIFAFRLRVSEKEAEDCLGVPLQLEK